MNPEPPVRPHGAGRLGFGERDDDATNASPLELEDILTTILETAYRWDFASDRIDWAANAQTVLGVGDPEMIGKGRAFALLVDPAHAGPRYDGITGGPHLPPGTELRYCLRYRFLPDGRRGRAAVWVEDTGVCAIDANCGRAWRRARSGSSTIAAAVRKSVCTISAITTSSPASSIAPG